MLSSSNLVPGSFAKGCDCCIGDIDPTLDACCARDLIEQRRTSALLQALRKVDPSTKTLRAREGVLLSTRDTTPLSDKAEDSDHETKSDSDESDAYSDCSDSSLMERLRYERMQEMEAKRRLVQVPTKEALDAAVQSNTVVILLVTDGSETRIISTLSRGLMSLASDELYQKCAFRTVPQRLLDDSMDAGLAVYLEGKLAAFRSDVREFADEDNPAIDSLHTFLDRAGVRSALLAYRLDKTQISIDEEHDEETVHPFCGMPGCTRTFQHNHIPATTTASRQAQSQSSIPREWDVDHSKRDILA